jgi:bifunctional UDP-N-acetylglucosamine pyrophosphorylase/glucosamine-1-phosphate N-acetyltransferase
MSTYRPLAAVVLAAGEGTRMRSNTPKVLHDLCGRPMILHVLDALERLPLQRIVVVVGHSAERVIKTVQEQLDGTIAVEFVEQRVQRGTGDAVSVALTAGYFDDLDSEDDLIVLPSDAPLIRAETLANLATRHRNEDAAATILTALVDDPADLGRIVRGKDNGVDRIVEHHDASAEELEIREINTSIYCFRRSLLAPALRRLSPVNAQGEYYLTDAVAVLRDAGHKVIAEPVAQVDEALMVNDRAQLADAERALRERINRTWMRAGVTMIDPARTYVDAAVELAPDVRLLPGTMLTGRTAVGAGSEIGPDTRIVDSIVGERVTIANSVVRESEIGDDCTVGPFAHLRAGTRMLAGAKIGDFVETKNAQLGEGAKANHLAYLGDVTVGPGANIGAGTITANYDGKNKHQTTIGANARTGSNSVLVAPVQIGDGAVIGAGSVVTNDVAADSLVRGVPARVVDGWVDPIKQPDDADLDPDPDQSLGTDADPGRDEPNNTDSGASSEG